MLDFEPGEISIPSGHFIGGKLVHRGGPVLDVLRPSDSQLLATLPDASDDLVDEAVQNAHAAWLSSGWGT